MLYLSSFTKALESLDRAVIRAQANPEDEEPRDATIQRFERGYIGDPEEWFLFREHRNPVAHVYNQE